MDVAAGFSIDNFMYLLKMGISQSKFLTSISNGSEFRTSMSVLAQRQPV